MFCLAFKAFPKLEKGGSKPLLVIQRLMLYKQLLVKLLLDLSAFSHFFGIIWSLIENLLQET